MKGRVEILSSDSEDEKEEQEKKKKEEEQQKKKEVEQKPPIQPNPNPSGLVGPPRPPAGTVLKRGKKKVVAATPAAAPPVFTPPPPQQQQGPPPAVSDDEQDEDDDEDDLPPPLEPLPFVAREAAEQRLKLKKEADEIARKKKEELEEKELSPPPKEEEVMIGPPRPSAAKAKKAQPSAPDASSSASSSSVPSYLERDLQDFPLFMDKLPETPSNNPDIAALQALAQEESPEERAENFKNSGNECMQHGGARYWDSAFEYYTRAIQCGSKDLPKVSVYFSNRAAVQILKKNYGHAKNDCKQALKLDPKNRKALYRAAKCYLELRKLQKALKYHRMCMALGKTQQLVELEREISKKMRKEALKEQKRAKEQEVSLEKQLQLANTLKERGYKFGSDDIYSSRQAMEQFNAVVHLFKNRENKDVVVTPASLIFPHVQKSNFAQACQEEDFVRDVLQGFFEGGADDFNGDPLYSMQGLAEMCVYVKTNDVFGTFKKQEWVRVKLSNTMGELMTCHKDYIIPVIPVLFVFHVSWKDHFFSSQVQEMYGTPATRPPGGD